MDDLRLTRVQLLAAEIFSYSYANYKNHLGIGNVRFDQMMPDDAKTLEVAVLEEWPITRVARKLEVDNDEAAALLDGARKALRVVDASNPAESFRESVRQLVERAADDGLHDADAIKQLVIQICYRASDLAYLLDAEDTPLSRYSPDLRREPRGKLLEGHFDEEE